ncbi:MAG: DUF5683 domain-containing protein [Fibrobacterales bacterium]
MKLILLLLLLFFYAPLFSNTNEENLELNKSGIEAIDTLPAYDWDIKTDHDNFWLGMGLSLFPGGGHYYTEHYVHGGFITGITLGLGFDIWVSKKYQAKKQEERIADIKEKLYSLDTLIAKDPETNSVSIGIRTTTLNELRKENDNRVKLQDQRNCEIAWFTGMYLYSIMDAYETLKNNESRSFEKKDPITAAWKAALIPGWGQIYNGAYGKAGLLYMAFLGSYVSYNSSQSVVRYFLKRKQTAELERAVDLEDIKSQLTNERKARNKYIWGPVFFYVYSIADAVVDAILSDFDSPVNLSLAPNRDPNELLIPELQITWEF